MKITTDIIERIPARVTTLENGWTVETWWDRLSKNWLTSTTDSEGKKQCALKRHDGLPFVGLRFATVTPMGAKVNHVLAVASLHDKSDDEEQRFECDCGKTMLLSDMASLNEHIAACDGTSREADGE